MNVQRKQSTFSVSEARPQMEDLLRRAELGETITIEPDVAKQKSGIDFERGDAYLKSLGVDRLVTWVAPDFDDPLPEDFLIAPESD
jgi:hypothetical protein